MNIYRPTINRLHKKQSSLLPHAKLVPNVIEVFSIQFFHFQENEQKIHYDTMPQ
jgi:hypothetical protein